MHILIFSALLYGYAYVYMYLDNGSGVGLLASDVINRIHLPGELIMSTVQPGLFGLPIETQHEELLS